MSDYKSKNRYKFLLQYHIIFVCKYRKKLFSLKHISDDIKNLSIDICNKNNILIEYMETDKYYIHYMIETTPNISICKIVKLIKSYTTYHIWRKHYKYLSKKIGMGQPEYKPVEKVGSKVYEAGSPITLDNG